VADPESHIQTRTWSWSLKSPGPEDSRASYCPQLRISAGVLPVRPALLWCRDWFPVLCLCSTGVTSRCQDKEERKTRLGGVCCRLVLPASCDSSSPFPTVPGPPSATCHGFLASHTVPLLCHCPLLQPLSGDLVLPLSLDSWLYHVIQCHAHIACDTLSCASVCPAHVSVCVLSPIQADGLLSSVCAKL
jgi:hypothetical protein